MLRARSGTSNGHSNRQHRASPIPRSQTTSSDRSAANTQAINKPGQDFGKQAGPHELACRTGRRLRTEPWDAARTTRGPAQHTDDFNIESNDQRLGVQLAAWRRGSRLVAHIDNTGPPRQAQLSCGEELGNYVSAFVNRARYHARARVRLAAQYATTRTRPEGDRCRPRLRTISPGRQQLTDTIVCDDSRHQQPACEPAACKVAQQSQRREHLAIGLNAVLKAVKLPAGITNLDTGLADVDGDDLTHIESAGW
jgi:hypothetical protein